MATGYQGMDLERNTKNEPNPLSCTCEAVSPSHA